MHWLYLKRERAELRTQTTEVPVFVTPWNAVAPSLRTTELDLVLRGEGVPGSDQHRVAELGPSCLLFPTAQQGHSNFLRLWQWPQDGGSQGQRLCLALYSKGSSQGYRSHLGSDEAKGRGQPACLPPQSIKYFC